MSWYHGLKHTFNLSTQAAFLCWNDMTWVVIVDCTRNERLTAKPFLYAFWASVISVFSRPSIGSVAETLEPESEVSSYAVSAELPDVTEVSSWDDSMMLEGTWWSNSRSQVHKVSLHESFNNHRQKSEPFDDLWVHAVHSQTTCIVLISELSELPAHQHYSIFTTRALGHYTCTPAHK